jgi:hypothetical protein|tara:strand:- start:44233 stop:45126 length:894 start_codon:yes stop_codon:yes gene_type:complete
MQKLHNTKALTLDSVAIEPRYSTILKEDTIDLEIDDKAPIWASSDNATGTIEIAEALSEAKIGTLLSTRYDIDELYNFFFEEKPYVAISIGDTEGQIHKWNQLKSKLPAGNIHYVNLVTQNAHSIEYIYKVAKFKEENKDVKIIAGPVSDPTATRKLFEVGAEITRIGFDARFDNENFMETGVGSPHVSVLLSNDEVAREFDGHIMASGFYPDSSDIAKCIACGASSVEISKLFYGHEESYGKTETIDGTLHKNGVEYNGKIINTVYDLLNTLEKSCRQAGYKSIKTFRDSAKLVII